MTDREKLYDWICQKAATERYEFENIEDRQDTYFKDYDEQPVLMEYDVDNRKDIEHYLDMYFDEELSEIKIECIKTILKNIDDFSQKFDRKDSVKKKSTGIREYIYNF